MINDRRYYVYLFSNRTRTLYVGVTNDLQRRIYEHKSRLVEGFTKRYYLNYLVYFEETTDVASAIAREKQIKSWRRAKKIDLMESTNPQWKDLSLEWYV